MYYSLQENQENLKLYRAFLYDVINHNDSDYKALFVDIIKEAIALANHTTNYYKISRDNYDVIAYLANYDKIKSFNADSLSILDFKDILTYLESQPNQIVNA